MRAEVDLDALARAIIARDADTVAALVADLEATLDDDEGLGGAASMALIVSAKAAASALRFSFAPEAARIHLTDYRATLIRSVAEKSAQAISETAARASAGGTAGHDRINPASQVRDSVGLTPAQARSLDTFRAVLDHATRVTARPVILTPDILRHLSAPQRAIVQRAAAGELSPEKVRDIVERHRKALVDHRAASIARTEAARLTNAGEHTAWLQAAERGVIDEGRHRRFWITAGDERVRLDHRAVPAMNIAGVGLRQPFKTPFGAIMHPPLEINCRCRVALRSVANA